MEIDRRSFLCAIRQASIDSPDMRRQFDALSEQRVVRSGEVLYHQGEDLTSITVNLDGVFRLYCKGDSAGNDLTVGFVKPGEITPPMSAIKCAQELCYSVEALVRTKVIFFSRSRFLELVESDIRWYRIIWNLLYEENAHRERRERSLLVSSAFTRYQEFLSEYQDVECLIMLKHIASYLGIQPATLSRIMSSPYRACR